jgi:hypothetical protein
MLTFLEIIGGVFTYAFIGGATGWTIYSTHPQRCKDITTRGNRYGERRCTHDIGEVGVATGVFWPLALPAAAGMVVAEFITSRTIRLEARDKRADRKHQRKLEELEAQRKLAKQQTEKSLADIKFLVENGIQADVPGLEGFDVGNK